MRRITCLRVVHLAAAALLGAATVRAQDGVTGVVRLRGRMIDSAGRAIAGVQLQLVGSARATESDSLGNFTLDSLTAGSVSLAITHPQFVALTLELPLAIGDTAVVPVLLVAPEIAPDASLEAGMLVGVVTDPRGRGLSGADVLVATSGQTARTDTLGRFVLRGLTPTKHLIKVRKLGYYVQYLSVVGSPGRALRASIAMESMGTTLKEIVVRADRIAPRLRGFRDRAANNPYGQFVTRDQMLEKGWPTVNDMLSHMRGVSLGVDAMNRQVPLGRAHCPMLVLLDGQPLELTDVALSALVNLNDLAGMEVYSGKMEAPLQFAYGPVTKLACGVVVFWTR
jgi:Carboxypeptidase regulatory-like domain